MTVPSFTTTPRKAIANDHVKLSFRKPIIQATHRQQPKNDRNVPEQSLSPSNTDNLMGGVEDVSKANRAVLLLSRWRRWGD